MEFLLTVFVVLFLIGLLIRLLTPFFLKLLAKRITRHFDNQAYEHGYQQNTRKQRPEGEVTIEQKQYHEKVINKDFGEYVDFEEEK